MLFHIILALKRLHVISAIKYIIIHSKYFAVSDWLKPQA